MTQWSRRVPFKVDIAGVIQIMGTSLYSRPDTPIRELIQNAHDAIRRRRRGDLAFKGRIDIEQDAGRGTLCFRDDGVGLSADEAERYLSTIGIGLTGLIKRAQGEEGAPARGDEEGLIGQFGIGLFSAFMLADRVVVESRRVDGEEGIRWEAGSDPEVLLSSCDVARTGTAVTLFLKKEHLAFGTDPDLLERSIKEHADFLTIPIHLNNSKARVNVANKSWFEPTPDPDAISAEAEEFFGEAPLDVIPVRMERPADITGALYVTPQHSPGFSDEPVVTVTVRRMIVSRRVRGLLPEWATFLRGVLELSDCAPTASREDLVRDSHFEAARRALEARLFEHFEEMARLQPARWASIVAWHRYSLAGAALMVSRLRALLRGSYQLPTSQGPMTFDAILEKSAADPLYGAEADFTVWYNVDRRQEAWMSSLFAGHDAPCVHALRSFEESLLAAWVQDARAERPVDLCMASPSQPQFATAILGVRDLEEAPQAWQEFFDVGGAQVLLGSYRADRPVMAFLNERFELARTFTDLRNQGAIPSGYQRLIDREFGDAPPAPNQVLLNRNHRIVARALQKGQTHPLASVLRVLARNALIAAGAAVDRAGLARQAEDLDWIADALWGRDGTPR